MSEPVIERIATEIQNRLDSYRPGGKVTIARLGRVVPDDILIVIQQQASRPLPQLNYPGNPPAVAFECIFNIQCFIHNQTNEVEFAKRCNQVVADVTRYVTNPPVDPVLWHSFGGLAINAFIGQSRDLRTEIGVLNGVIVPLIVQYRVSENDHTQVR